MEEPRWLERSVIDAIHYSQLQQHGGQPGGRDENALESALARPKNQRSYGLAGDLADLAASYGWGLARNHGFIDGNKRVAFMAMYTFLGLNGLEIEAPEPGVVDIMLSVASGNTDERELAEWLRAHVRPWRG